MGSFVWKFNFFNEDSPGLDHISKTAAVDKKILTKFTKLL